MYSSYNPGLEGHSSRFAPGQHIVTCFTWPHLGVDHPLLGVAFRCCLICCSGGPSFIFSMSLVATLCSAWSICCLSFLGYVQLISIFALECVSCQSSSFIFWSLSLTLLPYSFLFDIFLSVALWAVLILSVVLVKDHAWLAMGHCWEDKLVHYCFLFVCFCFFE